MTDLAPLPAEGDPHARLLAAYLDGQRPLAPSPILAAMQPDPELVEHYRQQLTAKQQDYSVDAYAMGFTVALVREMAKEHDRQCAGCSTCHHLRHLLSFIFAYELNEAPPNLLRRIHGMDPET